MSSLAERLKAQTEAETKAVAEAAAAFRATTESELQRLAESLSATGKDALQKMADDLAERQTALQAAQSALERRQARVWGMTIVGCLMVFLLTIGAIYGLTSWHRSEIATLQDELAELKQTKAALESWGVSLRETPKGRFVVLPAGKTWDPQHWSFGELEAVRIE